MKHGRKRFTKTLASLLIVVMALGTWTGGAIHAELPEGNYAYAFGDGQYGQLGLGDYAGRYDPTLIEGFSNVKSIASGQQHSLILTEDGKVYSFGEGQFGRLGHGNEESKTAPTQIQSLSNVKAVAAGYAHSLALTESGDVYSFGYGNLGETGFGYLGDKWVPTHIPGLPRIKAIAADGQQSFLLTESGDVYSFGSGQHGALGHGDTESGGPPTVIPNIPKMKAMAPGKTHTLLLTEAGEVYSFGRDQAGELGRGGFGNYGDKPTPGKVLDLPGEVIQIAAGERFSLILTKDGAVYSFGSGQYGALGLGDNYSRDRPTRINGLPPIKAIAAGNGHSLALSQSGTVYAFGEGGYGQLGSGNNNHSNVPVQIPGLFNVSAIFGGYWHTMVVQSQKALTAPSNLRVTGNYVYGEKLTLSWNAPEEAERYLLEISQDGGSTWQASIDNGSATSYEYLIEDMGRLQFRVKAVRDHYIDSGWSITEAMEVRKAEAPLPPAPQFADIQTRSISLQDQGANMEYGIMEGMGWNPDIARWQESAVFSDLQANSRYTVAVRSKETATHKQSPPSASVTAVTLAVKPSLTTAVQGTNAVRLTVQPGDNPAVDTQYRIERSETSDFAQASLVRNWNASLSFDDTELNHHTTYYYRVKARNSDGVETGWSDIVSAKTEQAQQAAPADVEVLGDAVYHGELTIRWSEVADSSGYAVQTSTDGGANWSDDIGIGSSTSYKIPIDVMGQYRFRVKALRTGYIDSAWTSSEIVPIRKAEPSAPPAPVIAARLTNGIALTDFGAEYEYSFDEGSDWSGGNGAWYEGANFSGLHVNTQYSFVVRRAETETETASAPSVAVAVYTLADVPALKITGTSGFAVSLIIEPGDNPAGTEYQVWVAPKGSSDWQPAGEWDRELDVTVNGLAEGTEYQFRAAARNGDGIETEYSETAEGLTKSSNAKLSSLEIEPLTLLPDFSPDQYDYEAYADAKIERIRVKAASQHHGARIRINGTETGSGVWSEEIALRTGGNRIEIAVTPEDGQSQSYELVVVRDFGLSDLQLGGGLTLDSEFASSKTDYSVAVTNDVYTVTVTPWAKDDVAWIEIHGVRAANGQPSQPIPLYVGSNMILIVAGTEGGMSKTYTLVVNREAPGEMADPYIIGTEPSHNAADVPVDQKLSIRFSTDILPTDRLQDIVLKRLDDEIEFAYSIDRDQLIVEPLTALKHGQFHTLIIPAGSVTDAVYNPLQETYQLTFRTVFERRGNDTGSGGGHAAIGKPSETKPSEQSPPPAVTPVTLFINGKEIGELTQMMEWEEGDTLHLVGTPKFSDLLTNDEYWKGDGKAVIELTAIHPVGTMALELNGQAIRVLADKQAIVRIDSGIAAYDVPIEAVYTGALAQAIERHADQVRVTLETAQVQSETLRLNETNGMKIIAPAASFSIRYSNGGASRSVTFRRYVAGEIALPQDANPHDVVAGIRIDANGSFIPVPVKILKRGERLFARLSSVSNGIFTVVSNPRSFADIDRHWAQDEMAELAARGIAEGTDDGNFMPDRPVGRAEFAAMIVRALGLHAGGSERSFDDVQAEDWFYEPIGVAGAYGLIDGYPDGSFRPQHPITREEAMAVILKAMKRTGMNSAALSEKEIRDRLAPFGDRERISPWAQEAAAVSIAAGVFNGDHGKLRPQDRITRAETAAILLRMLRYAELI
ncbi:hypothetical protein PAE9249_04625 [Paenibacillus sp. CECT 9249]|uniref:RCC1 domain-containing protein n=1 Tax=Paenibacillus sp. CECT 9249 TaxID=2845385 RepID=UPI001E2A6F34|nr:S-layer homology domain-containing protein [Paenibacillus sp. CECT 9249]CAH0122085.1 hypothetical protein PAE9249_04625 [Paenibacillus sp. CECT 9249]